MNSADSNISAAQENTQSTAHSRANDTADNHAHGGANYHTHDGVHYHTHGDEGHHSNHSHTHNPDEIRATLTAAKDFPHEKLWVIFQPHTYSRTKAFLDEFADALSLADAVVLTDIYAARETDTLGVSSDKLAEAVRARGTKASSYPCFEQIEDYLREHAQEGDLILTVGAGDVTQVGSDLAEKVQG